MVATVLQTVCIQSESLGSTDTIWQNQNVNSWMSVIPLKYIFQDETIGKQIVIFKVVLEQSHAYNLTLHFQFN